MKNVIKLVIFTTFIACSSSPLYLGKKAGSLYKTSELRRNQSDAKLVTIHAKIFKKLQNDFYLVKDAEGLLLVQIAPSLLGEDTSYDQETVFRLSGETENESSNFYVIIEDLEKLRN